MWRTVGRSIAHDGYKRGSEEIERSSNTIIATYRSRKVTEAGNDNYIEKFH